MKAAAFTGNRCALTLTPMVSTLDHHRRAALHEPVKPSRVACGIMVVPGRGGLSVLLFEQSTPRLANIILIGR